MLSSRSLFITMFVLIHAVQAHVNSFTYKFTVEFDKSSPRMCQVRHEQVELTPYDKAQADRIKEAGRDCIDFANAEKQEHSAYAQDATIMSRLADFLVAATGVPKQHIIVTKNKFEAFKDQYPDLGVTEVTADRSECLQFKAVYKVGSSRRLQSVGNDVHDESAATTIRDAYTVIGAVTLFLGALVFSVFYLQTQ